MIGAIVTFSEVAKTSASILFVFVLRVRPVKLAADGTDPILVFCFRDVGEIYVFVRLLSEGGEFFQKCI